ncbi:MAG: hypothetical protein KDD44_00935 [Bdellovibrionales bacterium]|nr:hypothetical protein [Bdellovibrionales bacterium]
MDPEKLLVDVNSGKKVRREDLDEIVAFLDSLDPETCEGNALDSAYACLLLLGRADLKERAQLFEKYLDCNDPLTVALSLEILCVEWDLTEGYLERVVSIALGAPWDPDGDAQAAAFKALGEHVRRRVSAPLEPRERRLLELILKSFSDPSGSDESREAAYRALLRVAGREWDEVPREDRILDLSADSDDIDGQAITSCRKLVAPPLRAEPSRSAVTPVG